MCEKLAFGRWSRSVEITLLVGIAVGCGGASGGDHSQGSGGASNSGGGSAGNALRGAMNGGNATGGNPTSGGTPSAGAANGGAANAGTANRGGNANGGAAMGGTANGGAANGGGNANGGAAMGGAKQSGGATGSGGLGGAAQCPPSAPQDGSACTMPINCVYLDCSGAGRVSAACDGHAFSVAATPCEQTPTYCGQTSCATGQICVEQYSGTASRECSANPCGSHAISCDCAASLCPTGYLCSTIGTTLRCQSPCTTCP